MITGEVKNKLDNLWDAMWSNQMTNPLIDIQQITYLIFIKMLDDQQVKKERKINDMIARGVKIKNYDNRNNMWFYRAYTSMLYDKFIAYNKSALYL